MNAYSLRAAEPRDLQAIVSLVTELAEYEQLTHLLEITPEGMAPHLFGPQPVVECVVGEVEQEVVGFALFFSNFSTFLGRPGLHLEDLYVRPEHRGTGLGAALFSHVGRLAVERGCGRLEWSVLDWNTSAIGFYEQMGATVLPDWRICRITGEALRAFSATDPLSPLSGEGGGGPGPVSGD